MEDKDAYEWDEERFAMEKVHGLNEFDDGDQAKFNSMDGESGFEDADWRALAASQAVVGEQAGDGTKEGFDIVGLLPAEAKQEQAAGVVVLASSIEDAATSVAAEPGPYVPNRCIGEIQVPGNDGSPSGIRIMRFTRKRTQRTRRKDVGAAFRNLAHQTPSSSLTAEQKAVKFEADAGSAPAPNRIVSPVKSETKPEMKKENGTTFEAKCVLVKARSIDDITDLKPVQANDGKKLRPKPPMGAADQQPNKKPKALAFQKSRNIINKRINAETVKPEPAANNINCVEVVAMQAKHSSAVAELRAAQDEIKSMGAADEEALKETPAALQANWLDTRCKLLGAKFGMHLSVVRHFLCHRADNCRS